MTHLLVTLQGILFSAILIAAGIRDYRDGVIPNVISLLILPASFIDFPEFHLLPSLLGSLVLSAPFLILWNRRQSIGGGDVKLIASGGFLLGIGRGFLFILIGSLLALIGHACVCMAKKADIRQAFPLGPYLAAGGILTFWITALWRW